MWRKTTKHLFSYHIEITIKIILAVNVFNKCLTFYCIRLYLLWQVERGPRNNKTNINVKEKLKNLVSGKGNAKATPEKHATGIDLELINAKTAEETKRLIAAGADVNAEDNYGYDVLYHCRYSYNASLWGGDYHPGTTKEKIIKEAMAKTPKHSVMKSLLAKIADKVKGFNR